MKNITLTYPQKPLNISDSEWTNMLLLALIEKRAQDIQEQSATADKISDFAKLTPKSVNKISEPDNLFYRVDTSQRRFWKDSREGIDWHRGKLMELYESLKSKYVQTHAENADALSNNKLIVEGITELLTKFGIKPYYETWEGKGRKARYVKVPAGYTSDIARYIDTDDGFDIAMKKLAAYMEYAENTYREYMRPIIQKEQEQIKIQRAQELFEIICELGVKYGLIVSEDIGAPKSYTIDAYDVLNAIFKVNKYVMLAHYLQKNRNDWSDGTYYAKNGLDKFVVESELDKEIYEATAEKFEDFEDGRIFRDGDYSYDELFNIGEKFHQDSYNDYLKIITKFYE